MRLQDRHFLALVKNAEIALLGRRASTYCYNFPSHIKIEVTTHCNLRCVWCNQADPEWLKKQGNRHFDHEAFLKLLPQLRGGRVLILNNIGEPLMYPHLFDAITAARKVVPQVRITTNAVLLNEERSRKLQEAGLTQINVSIDGTDPETFARVRGTSLTKIEQNLDEFCRLTNIPIHIWAVVSETNIRSLETLPDWATRFSNIEHLRFHLVGGFAYIENAKTPWVSSAEKFERFREKVLSRCEALGLETNLTHMSYYAPGVLKREHKGICQAPFTEQVSINREGSITPCCAMQSLSLEDVLSQGFRKAWNGPNMRRWRRMMLNQDYGPYCEDWCGFKKTRSQDWPPG
jgi:MoaA/NifB/PqqE/SkfB family radical SAM enzyme